MNKEIQPIQVGDITISADRNFHMAGPCTVESEEQTFAIAEHVAKEGVDALRGGAFKPRTNPEAFRGLREQGLAILFAAGREYNVPVVTEVMKEGHIELIRKASEGHPFIFQIGTRNAQNFDLLEAVGETGRPVILKRGKGSKVDEMLGAARYILKGGSPVVMCERGIETFSSASGTGRSTADFIAIPQFQDAGFLTVFDPSHAGGQPDYVIKLGLAGVAAGTNGLIVEVGIVDEEGVCHAQCDAHQALSFDQFSQLIDKARKIENTVKMG